MPDITLTTGNGVGFFLSSEDEDIGKMGWTAVTYTRRSGKSYTYIVRNRRPGRGSSQIGIHRLVLARMYSPVMMNDPNFVSDHINGNTVDNRRENLRLVSKAQNAHNQAARITNISGYRGVSWNPKRQRWFVSIRAFGKNRFIGWFKDKEEGARAWDAVAKDLYGEYARLNLPKEPNG